MTESDSGKWFEERVEAYVDGELTGGELRLFESRLALDERLARSVADARELNSALAELPHYRCPPDLAAKVARITDTEPRRWRWRTAAAVGAVALAATLTLDSWRPAREPALAVREPAAEELAAAREELAVALAYLDKAGAAAGREVGSQYVRPLERSLAVAEGSAG